MLAEPSLVTHCFSAAQVREMDRCAIQDHGIPGIQLMKNAGRMTFSRLLQAWPQTRRLLIFCGGGNNGGDGFIVAALALQKGISVKLLSMVDVAELQGDVRLAASFAIAEGVQIEHVASQEPESLLHDYQCDELSGDTVVVDALLGTGLKGAVRSVYAEMIRAVNNAIFPVLAVDIPSGLCSDSGASLGEAIKADLTVTFVGIKRGLLTCLGPENAGKIVFASLSLPAMELAQCESSILILHSSRLSRYFPRRIRHAHKGHHGHVMVIGGDSGLGGAVAMASEASLRVGAGLVSVATQPPHVAAILARRPEVMVHGVVSGQELEPLLDRASVLVIGPGLGRTPWSEQLLQKVTDCDCPVVLDADALNILAEGRVVTCKKSDQRILTPHPGEAARLLSCTVAEIQADRFAAVEALQQAYGGVVILKGAGTLIRTENRTFLSVEGNPGMGSGGMGDVLSGLIGGLLAQGFSLSDAAKAGVSLHNACADMVAANQGERGMIATDLFRFLPSMLNPDH